MPWTELSANVNFGLTATATATASAMASAKADSASADHDVVNVGRPDAQRSAEDLDLRRARMEALAGVPEPPKGGERQFA